MATSPLVGDVDLARILADVPPEYSLKGMYFARYVSMLAGASPQSGPESSLGSASVDEAWSTVQKELLDPPPNGKYHAFEAYPMSDYIRVFDRIARARFPGSTREAYRLLARGEVEVYAATTLGKVTFSMLRDAEVALVRYPELFGVLSKGPVVSAERTGPRRVAVTFERFAGSSEHVVGVLEGLAMEFDVMPSLEVEVDESRRAVFTVRW